jgi:hypothetical protein
LTSDNAKNILDITGGSAEDKIMAEIEEKSFIQKLQHDFLPLRKRFMNFCINSGAITSDFFGQDHEDSSIR